MKTLASLTNVFDGSYTIGQRYIGEKYHLVPDADYIRRAICGREIETWHTSIDANEKLCQTCARRSGLIH